MNRTTALTAAGLLLMALPLDAGFQSGDIAVIAEADIVGDRLEIGRAHV